MNAEPLSSCVSHRSVHSENENTPAQLELLRTLERHPEYSQRELATALGASLGKTHYLLKALLAKGWVKAQNFQRRGRWRFLYVLTPQGVKHRLQLTQLFLERKEAEYEMLRTQIGMLREELSASADPKFDQVFEIKPSFDR